jgi:hypothetical protein
LIDLRRGRSNLVREMAEWGVPIVAALAAGDVSAVLIVYF